MTTDTRMTADGMIIETIGVETIGVGRTGAGINGVESKPAVKLTAVVIGSAIMIGPCAIAMRTITATTVDNVIHGAQETFAPLPHADHSRENLSPFAGQHVHFVYDHQRSRLTRRMRTQIPPTNTTGTPRLSHDNRS